MKRTIQILARVILFFAILALILVGGGKIRQYGQESYQMIWYVLWTFLTPLLMAAFLLFDHIRAWFGKGKLRIHISYLIISALLLIMFSPPFSYICSFYKWASSHLMFVALVFWFCLIKAFYREKPE